MTHPQQPTTAIKKQNLFIRSWQTLKQPSASSLGSLLLIGFIVGLLFLIGFNAAIEYTNTETFCISCHEMRQTVYQEYLDTPHNTNSSGVRATCADCHVPKAWWPKIVRKIQASREVYHKIMGSIDTPEKFEAKRLKMAQSVWDTMKATDSRECRHCHDQDSMDYPKQGRRAEQQHIQGVDKGQTCIDCHKGIAHALPEQKDED